MPRQSGRPSKPRSTLPAWFGDVFACPECGGSLSRTSPALLCVGCGTRYPTQPHIDLLPAGKRPPNEGPGDSADMVRRRVAWERRIAASPSGESLALEQYIEAMAPHLLRDAVVVDLGCGTGNVLRAAGLRAGESIRLIGFDISRPMIDACYRTLQQEPRAVVARASTRRRLPLSDTVADVVLRRLAPALDDQIARVLKPGGAYISASVGPNHWRELYDWLPELPRPKVRLSTLDTVPRYGLSEPEVIDEPGFDRLSPSDALDRLLMGPAAFHVDAARVLPRLHTLAVVQGTPGLLTLTTNYVISVRRKH